VETIYTEDNRETSLSSNGIDAAAPALTVSLAAAERICRRIATGHYENFLVASVFLPRAMRQPFYNVYAYCRHADDLADESPTPEIATQKLADWQRQLQACFAGNATHPIFIALRDTDQRFDLRMEPFNDLIQAFLQDQVKVRYQTFDELLDYCRRSADPVGRIVLRLANADSDENLKLSDSVCTGLQLANHWQDVARDFRSGRIYLPAQDASRFGVDLERIHDVAQRKEFQDLLRFECDRAASFLRHGLPLASQVPRWLAKDIRLFIHGGLATLAAIANLHYDVLSQRPTVSRLRQMRLIVAAYVGRLD